MGSLGCFGIGPGVLDKYIPVFSNILLTFITHLLQELPLVFPDVLHS